MKANPMRAVSRTVRDEADAGRGQGVHWRYLQAGGGQYARYSTLLRRAVRQGRHCAANGVAAAQEQPQAAPLPAAKLPGKHGQALSGAIHARGQNLFDATTGAEVQWNGETG